MWQLLVSKDDDIPEQQEWNQSLDQEGSKLPDIKEEQRELWSDDENPQSSQLHQSQRDKSTEVELRSRNSTLWPSSSPPAWWHPQNRRTLKREADGDNCGGSQPARDCSYFQPHRDDMWQLLVRKDDDIPEQQEWNQSLDQQGSKLPDIKVEQRELWRNNEEKPQSSRLQQSQRDKSAEVELRSRNSTLWPPSSPPAWWVHPQNRKTLKTEGDGNNGGGSQPARDSGPCSHFQPHRDDTWQLLVSKDDDIPEQQEWNQSLDQQGSKLPHIKDEQRQLRSCDEEKPQSSQLHQSQRDKSTDVELRSRNSTLWPPSSPPARWLHPQNRRTPKREADGDNCGGSQPARDSGPCSPFQPHRDGEDQ
ncbi:uncharacterized protein LOC117504474 [Thalassophryne amazonica]|uniref:uncharacterized protein LOC117504474 n=1 Tax=Thalassophryne amazonica TaxID=390379 RepID=UPI001470904E|nr:uncharacterized protein LOC117504474 [Thalassophryne amazonica]